jgi:hypothetical protein
MKISAISLPKPVPPKLKPSSKAAKTLSLPKLNLTTSLASPISSNSLQKHWV